MSIYEVGDFTFVENSMWRRALENAYKQTTELDMWDFFKHANPPEDRGYMFWNESKLDKLRDVLDSDGHSGASMALCMRNIECIAKHGWEAYVDNYTRK